MALNYSRKGAELGHDQASWLERFTNAVRSTFAEAARAPREADRGNDLETPPPSSLENAISVLPRELRDKIYDRLLGDDVALILAYTSHRLCSTHVTKYYARTSKAYVGLLGNDKLPRPERVQDDGSAAFMLKNRPYVPALRANRQICEELLERSAWHSTLEIFLPDFERLPIDDFRNKLEHGLRGIDVATAGISTRRLFLAAQYFLDTPNIVEYMTAVVAYCRRQGKVMPGLQGVTIAIYWGTLKETVLYHTAWKAVLQQLGELFAGWPLLDSVVVEFPSEGHDAHYLYSNCVGVFPLMDTKAAYTPTILPQYMRVEESAWSAWMRSRRFAGSDHVQSQQKD
jgi:hypothetical protein